jgi:hypothetical protein
MFITVFTRACNSPFYLTKIPFHIMIYIHLFICLRRNNSDPTYSKINESWSFYPTPPTFVHDVQLAESSHFVLHHTMDRLGGLVVTVPVCKPRGPGFDSGRYQIFWVTWSGTGCTQTREDKWGATWKKSSGSGLENWD